MPKTFVEPCPRHLMEGEQRPKPRLPLGPRKFRRHVVETFGTLPCVEVPRRYHMSPVESGGREVHLRDASSHEYRP